MPVDPTRFVLVGTSHAGNVGAAARAMKVMGFCNLVLVQPRFDDVLMRDETLARASGATDVLARARVVATLADPAQPRAVAGEAGLDAVLEAALADPQRHQELVLAHDTGWIGRYKLAFYTGR